MKVRLMHRDRDVDLDRPLPETADALGADLGLGTLLDALSGGEGYLRGLAERALLLGLDTPDEIRYRQDILADCLRLPELVRDLYSLAVEGVEAKQKARFFWFGDSPETMLNKSLSMLELLTEVLERLRALADEHGDDVRSEGLTRLFGSLREELDDEYLALVREHLSALRFRDGVLLAAELGRGNRGANYVLRRGDRGLLGRLAPDWASGSSFSVPRDEHSGRALSELRDRGLALVANVLAQSTDHVLAFFGLLRAELGFYLACLNLHERLADLHAPPLCRPDPRPAEEAALSARGLYDVSLALQLGPRVVGSDLDADGKTLLVITGANEGGKSTFLRALGLSQLMLQAGMFAPARELRASVRTGVFTHFKREEDVEMRSGKLDEELQRMSEIADAIRPHGLLLCNESFASTNEAEGSEIARQVVQALLEADVRVAYVTHMYELANSFRADQARRALFLRAERLPDGERTFRIVPGEPEPTSYGADSYRRVFGRPPGFARSAAGDSPAASRTSSAR
jgi:hypothetical protein